MRKYLYFYSVQIILKMSNIPLPKDVLGLIFLNIDPWSIQNVRCVGKRYAAICNESFFKIAYKERWEYRIMLWGKIKDEYVSVMIKDVKKNGRMYRVRNAMDSTLLVSESPMEWKTKMVKILSKYKDTNFRVEYLSDKNVIEITDGGSRIWIQPNKFVENPLKSEDKEAMIEMLVPIFKSIENK